MFSFGVHRLFDLLLGLDVGTAILIGSQMQVSRVSAMASVVVAFSPAPGGLFSRCIWLLNFAQTVRWWRRREVRVERLMFKVVAVTAAL